MTETAAVLRPLGLTLSLEKTRITHIDEGFDFLGWRIKRDRGRRGRAGHLPVPVQGGACGRQGEGQGRSPAAAPTSRSTSSCTGSTRCCGAGAPTSAPGKSSRTFQYLRHYTWRRVVGWLRRKYPEAQLALAATPPPPRLVADRQGDGALQPGGGQHHPLPLPGRAHRDSLAVRTDRLARCDRLPRATAIPVRR